MLNWYISYLSYLRRLVETSGFQKSEAERPIYITHHKLFHVKQKLSLTIIFLCQILQNFSTNCQFHHVGGWKIIKKACWISLCQVYFQGSARTQSPTIKNCDVELPTLGVITGVSLTTVQWKGLALGDWPSWSPKLPAQVSMTSISNTFWLKHPTKNNLCLGTFHQKQGSKISHFFFVSFLEIGKISVGLFLLL